MDFTQLQHWIEAFSYPAVLGLLISAGFGAPVSEDAIMIAAGMVIAHANGSLIAMILVAWVGVVIGDSALWRIGSRLGTRAVKVRHIQRVLTPSRLAWVERHFERYGVLTIFFARFLIGFRSVTFLSAGTTGMSYRRFIIADALGAAIFVPTLVWLGWRFGEAVLDDVKGALAWLLGGAIAVVLTIVVVSVIRRRAQLARARAA